MHNQLKNQYLFALVILFVISCTPNPRFHDKAIGKRSTRTQNVKHSSASTKMNLRVGYSWKANASYYGPKFNGRKTANGEVFDMNGISAAHKTLSFGTVLEVKNLNNGRKVRVRINDRGPFIKGRDLDLSLGAARKIDSVKDGVVPVKLTIISLGK